MPIPACVAYADLTGVVTKSEGSSRARHDRPSPARRSAFPARGGPAAADPWRPDHSSWRMISGVRLARTESREALRTAPYRSMIPAMLTVTLPDGRPLHLINEGPTGNWVAQLDGAEGKSATGRWLLAVVGELLDLPKDTKPPWVLDLVRQVAGQDTSTGRRYACPCCDFPSLAQPPTGTFAICPICRWEDDNIQFEDLDRKGGANTVSLRQARQNFRQHGVSGPRRRQRARPPRPEEKPGVGQG
jgi:Cysteine-rich CPCC